MSAGSSFCPRGATETNVKHAGGGKDRRKSASPKKKVICTTEKLDSTPSVSVPSSISSSLSLVTLTSLSSPDVCRADVVSATKTYGNQNKRQSTGGGGSGGVTLENTGETPVVTLGAAAAFVFAASPQDSRVQFAGSVQMSSPTPNKQLAEMTTVSSTSATGARAFQLAPTRLYETEVVPPRSIPTTWPVQVYREPVGDPMSFPGQSPMTVVQSKTGVCGAIEQQGRQKPECADSSLSRAAPLLKPVRAPAAVAPIRFSAPIVQQNIQAQAAPTAQQQQQSAGFYVPLPAHHSSYHSAPPSHSGEGGGGGMQQQSAGRYGYPEQYSYPTAFVSRNVGYLQPAHVTTYSQVMTAPGCSNDFTAYKTTAPPPRPTSIYTSQRQLNDQFQFYQSQMLPAVFRHANHPGASQFFVPPPHEAFPQSFAVQSMSPYSQFVFGPTPAPNAAVQRGSEDRGVTGASPRSRPSPTSEFSAGKRSSPQVARPDLTDISYSRPKSTSSQTKRSKDCAVQVDLWLSCLRFSLCKKVF